MWGAEITRFLKAILSLAAVTVLVAPAVPAAEKSPYAGLEKRGIKAMPSGRIADIEAGKGAGYALTAELNGYPGPRHVLDLTVELKLTPRQMERTETLFRSMQREAKALGRELIAGETALEALFAQGRIDETALRTSVASIAEIEGRLRTTNLKYHLIMKSLLNRTQLAAYNRLRGYGDGKAAEPAMPAGHHGR